MTVHAKRKQISISKEVFDHPVLKQKEEKMTEKFSPTDVDITTILLKIEEVRHETTLLRRIIAIERQQVRNNLVLDIEKIRYDTERIIQKMRSDLILKIEKNRAAIELIRKDTIIKVLKMRYDTEQAIQQIRNECVREKEKLRRAVTKGFQWI